MINRYIIYYTYIEDCQILYCTWTVKTQDGVGEPGTCKKSYKKRRLRQGDIKNQIEKDTVLFPAEFSFTLAK